jgi:hypothetical protein
MTTKVTKTKKAAETDTDTDTDTSTDTDSTPEAIESGDEGTTLASNTTADDGLEHPEYPDSPAGLTCINCKHPGEEHTQAYEQGPNSTFVLVERGLKCGFIIVEPATEADEPTDDEGTGKVTEIPGSGRTCNCMVTLPIAGSTDIYPFE